MIDLHCHILPGVDDGPKTMEESLAMARLAVNEGITHISAAPHHLDDTWINEKSKIIQLVKEVQYEIDSENLPLTLFPGQEIHIYGDVLNHLDNDTLLYIDASQQYILLEFPSEFVPEGLDKLFYDLRVKGKTPVIVGPERNLMIQNDLSILKHFVRNGVLAQLTAASLVGKSGKKAEKASKQMIEQNLVHYIASDAHNTTDRSFYMKEARNKVLKKYGRPKWHEFEQNSKDLLNGETIEVSKPASSSKKKVFGLF